MAVTRLMMSYEYVLFYRNGPTLHISAVWCSDPGKLNHHAPLGVCHDSRTATSTRRTSASIVPQDYRKALLSCNWPGNTVSNKRLIHYCCLQTLGKSLDLGSSLQIWTRACLILLCRDFLDGLFSSSNSLSRAENNTLLSLIFPPTLQLQSESPYTYTEHVYHYNIHCVHVATQFHTLLCLPLIAVWELASIKDSQLEIC